MNTDPPPSTSLNERRRFAVKLRLEGRKLKEISKLVDLSPPTIIAAHKQFIAGGWDAVEVNPRGRPTGDRAATAEIAEQLRRHALDTPVGTTSPWTFALLSEISTHLGTQTSVRSVGKYIDQWDLTSPNLYKQCKEEGRQNDWLNTRYADICSNARTNHAVTYWAGANTCSAGHNTQDKSSSVQKYIYAHTTRGKYYWLAGDYANDVERFIEFFTRLARPSDNAPDNTKLAIIWQGQDPHLNPELNQWLEQSTHIRFYQHPDLPKSSGIDTGKIIDQYSAPATHHKNTATPAAQLNNSTPEKSDNDSLESPTKQRNLNTMSLTHLQRLEAESIHIMREVIAEADKPVMLYSIGKDSAVMLHLAQKAFYPAKPPFPLLHVDTGWKFQAMYEFRNKVVKDSGLQLITHTNAEGVERGVNPFTHGSALHTDIMKTQGLRQALDKHGFDVAFGGARRDEEMSRAKERVLSFRNEQHRWDPKNQRPELWNLYNTKIKKGESIRAFPLSNWTELDIWQYIHQQQIPVVPLYFAAERPVVLRDGTWIMVDDERMPMNMGEVPMMKRVRFRTLGCYPLTGAIESSATTVPEVITEMLASNQSERQGRMIDHDGAASMEKKKQEGYF